MGPCLQSLLLKLCEFPQDQKLELKYRASRDGFKGSDFHSKCDGISNILTVIKAKNGNIFGGFTEQEWHSEGDWVTDPNAFIFSLVNEDEKPFKVLCSNAGKNAFYCGSNYGPCFGGEEHIDRVFARDIFIETDLNLKNECYSNFGYAYLHPDYLKGTTKAKNILAGSLYFETLEI
jgi:hypothetical protein